MVGKASRVIVEERGEQALAIPPKGAFNRLAWLLPVLGFSVGIGLIAVWTRRWTAAGTRAAAQAAPAEPDPYFDQLDRELAARG